MSSMEEEWNNAKQQLLQIDFKGFKIQKYKEPILDYSQVFLINKIIIFLVTKAINRNFIKNYELFTTS